MKIGIIGSGNVGGTLGVRWAKSGHTVAFSSRDPQSDEMKQLTAKAGGRASAETVPAASAASDILLLATPWPAARDALSQAGNLAGKVLIDATNPLRPDLSGLAVGGDTSAAEQIASWHPEASVVKAFNTVGFNIMQNPHFTQGKVFMPYCGNSADAKNAVKTLAADLDFEPFDAGPLKQARLLEPFAMLWISIAFGSGMRDFAFSMLRRSAD